MLFLFFNFFPRNIVYRFIFIETVVVLLSVLLIYNLCSFLICNYNNFLFYSLLECKHRRKPSDGYIKCDAKSTFDLDGKVGPVRNEHNHRVIETLKAERVFHRELKKPRLLVVMISIKLLLQFVEGLIIFILCSQINFFKAQIYEIFF